MAKLSTVLNKLRKIGVSVTRDKTRYIDIYRFSIGSDKYEFSNNERSGDNVSSICGLCPEGRPSMFYNNITQLIKISSYNK